MAKRSAASQNRFLNYVVDSPRSGGSALRKIIPWRRAGCGFLYKDNPDGSFTVKDRTTGVRVVADTLPEGVGLCRDALKEFNDGRFHIPHAETEEERLNAEIEAELAFGPPAPAPPVVEPDPPYRRQSRVITTKSDGTCSHCHSPIRVGQRVWINHEGRRAHEVCFHTKKCFNEKEDYIKIFEQRAYLERGKWITKDDVLLDEGPYLGRAMSTFIQRFDHLKSKGYDMKWDASWMSPGRAEMWGTDGRGVKATLLLVRIEPETAPEPRPKRRRKNRPANPDAPDTFDAFSWVSTLSQEKGTES